MCIRSVSSQGQRSCTQLSWREAIWPLHTPTLYEARWAWKVPRQCQIAINNPECTSGSADDNCCRLWKQAYYNASNCEALVSCAAELQGLVLSNSSLMARPTLMANLLEAVTEVKEFIATFSERSAASTWSCNPCTESLSAERHHDYASHLFMLGFPSESSSLLGILAIDSSCQQGCKSLELA